MRVDRRSSFGVLDPLEFQDDSVSRAMPNREEGAAMTKSDHSGNPDALPPTARFDRLLDEIYPRLNALHGIDRSRRFWAILIHRYLRKCLMAGEVGLDPDRPLPPATHDNAVLGPFVGAGETAPVPEAGVVSSARARLRGRWDSFPRTPRTAQAWLRLRRLNRTPMDGSRSVLFGFHYFHVIAGLVDPPAAPLNLPSVGATTSADPSKRNAFRELEASADWRLVRLALRWLPTWYVEEFEHRDDAVRLQRPIEQAFHASFLPTPEGRFHIARHVEEGAAFTMYQHAGTYGEMKEDVAHHIEAWFADRYRTWGWELLPKDSPFLALRLLKPPGEEVVRRTPLPRWLYINIRDPYPWFIPETIDTQERFFFATRLPLGPAGSSSPTHDEGRRVGSTDQRPRPRLRAGDRPVSRPLVAVRRPRRNRDPGFLSHHLAPRMRSGADPRDGHRSRRSRVFGGCPALLRRIRSVGHPSSDARSRRRIPKRPKHFSVVE